MIQAREYQDEASDFLTMKRRAAVKSAAGSGKTVIAALALKKVLAMKYRPTAVKVGWLANTMEQCQQAFKALVQIFCGLHVTTAEAESVWLTHSHEHKLEIKVACAAAFTDWSERALLIVDECHHAATAPLWRTQIETCTGAIWGFTATPPEDFEAVEEFARIFGEVFEIARDRVQANLAAARVVMLDKTDQNLRGIMDSEIEMELHRRRRFSRIPEEELWGQVAWQVCIERGIVNNNLRNRAVIDLARRHAADQVLVLVNQVEHGKALQQRIGGKSLMCFSKMGAKARRESLTAFCEGRCRCLIATSLADEGLDLPNANVLILVSGGRNRARTAQRTGRVLRAFKGKSHGLIYDFMDSQHPLMAKHSRRRIELYQELAYKIDYEK